MDVVDDQEKLSAMAQMEEIGDNPYELGEKIEAQKVKENKMKSFDNDGDSTNDNNKTIPKRNLTDNENDQISKVRKGQHSIVYDNEPSDRFKERMERDMGEEFTKLRDEQMEFQGEMPMYNKDDQPIKDTDVDAKQYNKYKKGFISQNGLDESLTMTAKYKDDFNKTKYVNFKLNEVKRIDKIDESYTKLNLDGLGNRYTTKVEKINEMDSLINDGNFYLKENNIYIYFDKKVINESEEKNEKVVNENYEKMKKLWGYNPNKFLDTKNARKILK
jgi:predicted transcriptional regulator with HTH domain